MKHETEVVRAGHARTGLALPFTGKCRDCGWQGPPRATSRRAELDGEEHAVAVSR